MSAITIQPVPFPHRSKDFFRVPYKIYQNDPHWVPPLISEQRRILHPGKNPFFAHADIHGWIARVNGELAGRVVAIDYPKFSELHGADKGLFGFFECTDDTEVFARLMAAAYQWLAARGKRMAIGPVNLDSGNECGVLVEGFDAPPCILMNHSPRYYKSLFTQAGFAKEHDLLAFMTDGDDMEVHKDYLARMKAISDRVMEQHGLVFRNIDLGDFPAEVERLGTLYNDLLSRNWGFVPLGPEDFHFAARTMKQVADPTIISFLEKGDETIGCTFSMPDINQVLIRLNGRLFPFGFLQFLKAKKIISRTRTILLGVKPEYRHRGFAILLIYRTIVDSLNSGYFGSELSWISEDNHNLISIFNAFNARLHKRYRVYRKDIT
jgi:hypothetical protein